MLQFILKYNEQYSAAEMAQMVIEGGCAWIQIHDTGLADEQVREMCSELIPLCKEAGVILTIENRYELAKELGLSGVVLLGDTAAAKAPEVRELFGPEAIIGATVASAETALVLARQDIDYGVWDTKMSLEEISRQTANMEAQESVWPTVVSTELTLQQIPTVMSCGAKGLATTDIIANSDDPVAMTAAVVDVLTASVA